MVRKVQEALASRVRRDLIDDLETVVSSWSSKSTPDWEHKIKRIGTKLVLEIFSAGPNEMIFQYVDKGTQRHDIPAANAPLLIFQLGYSAKTAYRGLGNVGSGTASGTLIKTRVVDHPGSEARDFSGKIAEQYKDEFVSNMRSAVRDGLNL